MAANHQESYPHVIFRIKDALFALSSRHVVSMVTVPKVNAVPMAPPWIRGVINLRGEILPLVDLRVKLDMPSAMEDLEEFCAMLEQREQDHRDWLAELEASVHERRPFSLTTDPHQCAFGRWYDGFRTEDRTAESIIKRFAEPHARIHAVAHEVEALAGAGDFEAALATIQRTHGAELSQLTELFAQVRHHYRHEARELAMVIEHGGLKFSVTVDAVAGVEEMAGDAVQDTPGGLGDASAELVTSMGHRRSDRGLVQMLDIDVLVGAVEGVDLEAGEAVGA